MRFFPSLTDLAFLFPVVALFTVFEGARTLLSDGDTGWHIRTGDWILQHGSVPHKDIFSFTMPHRNWFAWEWGWDVLFAGIHSHWALSGIVLVNVFLLGIISVLLYRLVRRKANNDVLAMIVTCSAIFGSSMHWLARPHLLSWVFVLVFLHLIDRAEQGNTRLLWWSPLLTLFWVNLHGSFFIGIFFLLTYGVANSASALANSSTKGPEHLRAQLTYFWCALACSCASLVNPYGWHLHEHVLGYLTDAKQLNRISEYASVSFHSPLALAFELFIVLGICAASRAFGEGRWADALTLLIWAHFALKSARNIPIFLFIAAPLSAAFLTISLERIRHSERAVWLRNLAAGVLSFGQDYRTLERTERMPLIPVAAMCLVAALLGVFPTGRARISDFNEKDFPVAAASLIAQWPDARVFTFDQWGDYLIYRMFPRRAAFVDGRSDFYGSEFTGKWVNAISAKYQWKTELSALLLDTVLLRTGDPLASVLKQSSDWKPVFDDGRAIVFRRVAQRKLRAD